MEEKDVRENPETRALVVLLRWTIFQALRLKTTYVFQMRFLPWVEAVPADGSELFAASRKSTGL